MRRRRMPPQPQVKVAALNQQHAWRQAVLAWGALAAALVGAVSLARI